MGREFRAKSAGIRLARPTSVHSREWIVLLSTAVAALLIALLVELYEPRGRPAGATAVDAAPSTPRRGPPRLDSSGPAAAPEEVPIAWPYESLDAEEREVVDRGRDVAGWEEVHRGFSEGVAEPLR